MKTLLFVYSKIFDFTGYDLDFNVFVSKNFVDSVLNLLFSEIVIHHSRVSGNIIGYAHNFCDQNLKENYEQKISVFAHNLFRFDFFFVLKGLTMSVWKNKDVNKGGKGIRNLSYANIADQVKSIDTIKFY